MNTAAASWIFPHEVAVILICKELQLIVFLFLLIGRGFDMFFPKMPTSKLINFVFYWFCVTYSLDHVNWNFVYWANIKSSASLLNSFYVCLFYLENSCNIKSSYTWLNVRPRSWLFLLLFFLFFLPTLNIS